VVRAGVEWCDMAASSAEPAPALLQASFLA
jgi:hypothetical protein